KVSAGQLEQVPVEKPVSGSKSGDAGKKPKKDKVQESTPPKGKLKALEAEKKTRKEDKEKSQQTAKKTVKKEYNEESFLDAVKAYEKKEIDKAIKKIKTCIKQHPGHPGAYYYAGIIRYEKGEYDKALINFKKGLAYPGKGYNGHLYRGKIFQKLKKPDKALREYKEYVKLTKSEAEKQEALEYIKQLSGKRIPQTGKGKIKNAVERKASGAAVYFYPDFFRFFIPDTASPGAEGLKDAVDHFSRNILEQSISILKHVVLEYGGDEVSRFASLNLATVYLKLGLYENSESQVREFLRMDHRTEFTGQAKFILARSLMGLHKWDEAEEILKDIKPDEKYGPSRRNLELGLAEVYAGKGNINKAISSLKGAYNAVKGAREKAALDYEMAKLHIMLKQHSKAVSRLEKVAEICADSAFPKLCSETLIQIADLLYKQKKWDSALNKYREFTEKFPGHNDASWCYYQTANIYKTKKQYKTALDNYRIVIERFPESYWSTQAKWKQDDAVWQNEYKEVFD
ncbi:tetratricopeptide repeat protein, partial [Fibrobacterota bacterium]